MKYEKGTFVVVPNKEYLKGKPSELQTIYLWLVDMADENGGCFPTKKTIAKFTGCGHNTVDKYLAILEKDGLIEITPRYKSGKKENTSNYYQLLLVVPPNQAVGIPQIGTTGIPQIGSQTIPSINNTHITVDNTQAKEDKKGGELNVRLGKNYILRLFKVYSILFEDKFGFKPKINMGLFGKTIKSLVSDKTEIQIATLLVVFFNWRGMSGSDEYAHQRLVDATFNISWFKSSINSYEAYARNVICIDLDNEINVREFLKDNLSKLST